MRTGLLVSSTAHIAFAAWGFVSIPNAKPLESAPIEAVAVELVEISDTTDLALGDPSAENVDVNQQAAAPEPVEPAEIEAPPPPREVVQEEPAPVEEPLEVAALPPEAVPEPLPEPLPTPEPEPEPAPEPTPEVSEEKPAPLVVKSAPKPRPKRPAPVKTVKKEEPNKKFDANKIAALLDRSSQEETPTVTGAQQEAGVGSRFGRVGGAMTLSELDALRMQIQNCWSPPLGATDADELRVEIQISLNQDGTLSSMPKILSVPGGRYGRIAAESALRAVRKCAPYQLPSEKYAAWRDVQFNFDPQSMF